MKAINIHSRVITQPKEKVSALLDSLSSHEDKLWPKEKWPAMKFKEGLKVGARGGHGIIRYSISEYKEGEKIVFTFNKPDGFNGTHRFEVEALDEEKTKLTHIIEAELAGIGIISWHLVIRWLHDALLEDSLDKAENHFLTNKKKTPWNIWVRLLRYLFLSYGKFNSNKSTKMAA